MSTRSGKRRNWQIGLLGCVVVVFAGVGSEAEPKGREERGWCETGNQGEQRYGIQSFYSVGI